MFSRLLCHSFAKLQVEMLKINSESAKELAARNIRKLQLSSAFWSIKFFLWSETKRENLCYHIDNCADPRSLGDGETEKKWFYHHFELLFVEPLKIRCNFQPFDFLKCQYISLNRFMHNQFLLLSNTLDYKRTKKSFVGVNSTWKF